jgi:beta-lactamase class D
MKKILLPLFACLVSCSSPKKEEIRSESFAEFPPNDSCISIYDMKAKKFSYVSDVANCFERYPACSTFKIPLAVMAFDAGVIKDKNSSMKWDGVTRAIPAWNKDHTAESWMKDSVVWYSQKLTQKIGMKKIEEYLKFFRYGNQDMSSGLKYSWLTPAPFIKEPMSNSLRISGVEQAFFLRDLFWGSHPRVGRDAQRKARNLLSEIVNGENVLKGKTGSGFIGEKNELRVGWFVGHLLSGDKEYIVVSNFVDKQKLPGEATYGGAQAREMLLMELRKQKLW